MFAVQTLLGALAVKSRLSRLGATVAPGVETVVVFHFLGRRARRPSLCMMRITRLRLTSKPPRRSSAWTRGLP